MERRRLSRVPFNIGVIIKYSNKTFKGEVKNISLSGLFIQSGETIPAGETVEVIISLTGDTSSLSVNVEGTVVRAEEGGIGVQYSKVDLDSFIHLKNIVSYNINDPEKVMEEYCKYVKDNTSL